MLLRWTKCAHLSTIKVATEPTWSIYQKFLTHLTDFFKARMKANVLSGPNGSFNGNVHLSSGPFMWSALYYMI